MRVNGRTTRPPEEVNYGALMATHTRVSGKMTKLMDLVISGLKMAKRDI